MDIDYIILGQGLCGTLLSRCLMNAGKTVVVIDKERPFTSSKVASGVINPVTGRRIVRTWKIEELLRFALKEYNLFGKQLNEELVTELSIVDFFPGNQMREAFEKRLPEESEYLHHPTTEKEYQQLFNYHFGVGEIAPCLLVDLNTMLQGWRTQLKQSGTLIEEEFLWENVIIKEDHAVYKDLNAQKIICCEGVAGFDNPYFKNLPYSRMKGEAIIASIPILPRNKIYKQGVNIVPWKEELFWIGSTYEWDFKDVNPTELWRRKVEEHLKHWLKIPFKIVDHLASERPANMERRPFVGLHPQHSAVGIFNGMGAKGCSLAPFFAEQFTSHLMEKTPLYPEVDVRRFEKVLLRNIN